MSSEPLEPNSVRKDLFGQVRNSVNRLNGSNIPVSDTCLTRNRLCCLLIITLIILFYVLIYGNSKYFSMIPFSIMSDGKSSFTDPCRWVFHHYSSSPWEKYWSDNIRNLQNRVCPTLMQNDEFNKSITTLQYIIKSQKSIAKKPFSTPEYDALLSKMYYQYSCPYSQPVQPLVSQYIEPLIGLLRDPLTICTTPSLPQSLVLDKRASVQSKRFFLLGPSAAYQDYHKSIKSIVPWLSPLPTSQKILFDLGASYFLGSRNETLITQTTGARWFHQYFLEHSLSFDRIIAFEAIQYSPPTYWKQIPDDLMGKLTFINSGVATKGKFNPWNILKNIAKVEDYVIIKLDIDSSRLEGELVNQIINNRSISSLIDEMFFEMHITVKEMTRYWGKPSGELKDTYILFEKLRKLGIRMHSWP